MLECNEQVEVHVNRLSNRETGLETARTGFKAGETGLETGDI